MWSQCGQVVYDSKEMMSTSESSKDPFFTEGIPLNNFPTILFLWIKESLKSFVFCFCFLFFLNNRTPLGFSVYRKMGKTI